MTVPPAFLASYGASGAALVADDTDVPTIPDASRVAVASTAAVIKGLRFIYDLLNEQI